MSLTRIEWELHWIHIILLSTVALWEVIEQLMVTMEMRPNIYIYFWMLIWIKWLLTLKSYKRHLQKTCSWLVWLRPSRPCRSAGRVCWVPRLPPASHSSPPRWCPPPSCPICRWRWTTTGAELAERRREKKERGKDDIVRKRGFQTKMRVMSGWAWEIFFFRNRLRGIWQKREAEREELKLIDDCFCENSEMLSDCSLKSRMIKRLSYRRFCFFLSICLHGVIIAELTPRSKNNAFFFFF